VWFSIYYLLPVSGGMIPFRLLDRPNQLWLAQGNVVRERDQHISGDSVMAVIRSAWLAGALLRKLGFAADSGRLANQEPRVLISFGSMLPRETCVCLECLSLRGAGFGVAAITSKRKDDPAYKLHTGVRVYKCNPPKVTSRGFFVDPQTPLLLSYDARLRDLSGIGRLVGCRPSRRATSRSRALGHRCQRRTALRAVV
jgi:hypothetical protein